jgi:hypothetical protein
MAAVPQFLSDIEEEEEGLAENELQQLENLVKRQLSYEKEIAELEKKLEEKKNRLFKVSSEDIPNLLHQHGFSELRLRSGQKVIVVEGISITIPEEKEELFYAFLRERKEDDIIKLQVAFDKMPKAMKEDLFTFLSGYGYQYETKMGVHSKTKESYFKHLLGVGDENRAEGIKNGKYLTPKQIESFATAFSYFKTKIK